MVKRHDHVIWLFSIAMVPWYDYKKVPRVGIYAWNRAKDLEEMTLLVDVSTDLHDVQEAHMRFRRQSDEPDELSALQSGMPSMRKFVAGECFRFFFASHASPKQFGQWDCVFLIVRVRSYGGFLKWEIPEMSPIGFNRDFMAMVQPLG